MRGYWCKNCNNFIDKRNVRFTKKGITISRIINEGFIDAIDIAINDVLFPEFAEKKMICNICGGPIRGKKIPKHQIQAMNMVQAMNMEEIKDGLPPEEEKFDKYLERANLLFTAMEYEDSIIYWKMVLTIKPEDTTSWIMIGKSYEKIGDWNKAIESYSKALKINPSDKSAKSHKEKLEKRIAKIYNL